MQCVILAGGLGTRMHPRTEMVPKALLPVAGQPFAAWQLQLIADEGVDEVVYSLGHLGEQIEAFVRDGSRWGLTVRYSYERDGLLGTAGALRLAVDAGLLTSPFFALYGDSYLPIRFGDVAEAFVRSGQPALMTVYHNADRWEVSNACYDGGLVTRYDKDVRRKRPDMDYVDYGLSVLTPDIVTEYIPAAQVRDLSDTFRDLSVAGRLAGYVAPDRFFEIGSPQGIAALAAYLSGTTTRYSASPW